MRAFSKLLFLCGLFVGASLVRGDEVPTYEKTVAPFLKVYCVGCHDGGDDSNGGLNVSDYKGLMAGGDGGEAIVAGKSDESRLVELLLGTDQPKMPPKDAKQPKAEEIALIRRWIDLGAKGPSGDSAAPSGRPTLTKISPRVAISPAVTAVVFSPDGKWLAAARNREVLLFEAQSGSLSQTFTEAENPINSLAFSPNSRFLAAAEGEPGVAGSVRVWELGKPGTRTFAGHTDSIYSLAFSPDGSQLATASYDKLLLLWDVATGAARHTLKHHTAAVFGTAFSPDGKSLASVAADQTVKLWNSTSGERILTLTEPTKGLYAVAFHPQGHELVAAGIDKMLRVYDWNGTVAKLKRSTFAHDAPLIAVTLSPDGQTLFTASEDRRIKAWDFATLRERHVYADLPDWPLALAVNPAGTQLAVGLFNGELVLFETRSPQRLRSLLSKPPVALDIFPPKNTLLPSPIKEEGRRGGADTSASAGHPYTWLVAALLGQQPEPAAVAEEPKPNPPTPRFDSVSPRTVVRGNKVKLTLNGQNVTDADQVFVSAGNLTATLLPKDEKNANAAFCEIDFPADFSPGMVTLRLHTPLGTAGQKSFYVGPYPETGEQEPNDGFDRATAATLPLTLVGTINSRGDRDLWSFDAQSGQELAFLLVGPNLGSSVQAKLTLLDSAGKVLSRVVRQPGRETLLGYKFETAGRYTLQVEDRDNTGGGNHFYYIHAGSFPVVTDVFPLGLRSADQGEPVSGEVTALTVRGFNLPADSRIAPAAGVGTRFFAPESAGGKTFVAGRYESSPFAEFADASDNDVPARAMKLPVPGAVSGRLGSESGRSQSDGGQRSEDAASSTGSASADYFAFDAKRGERLTIETFARRLGSPADTVLEMLDSEGRPVPRATLRAVAETYTVLRDHDSRSKGIRLQAWDDFQPNDYLLLGAEIVKVQILPLGPDEDVKFFDRMGPRTGYFGRTPQAHAINSTAYKVELHPPGSKFAPNGKPVVELNWTSDDAPGLGADSQILFDVPADGRYLVRVRDVRGLAGDDFVYRLVIRPRAEDFRISLDSGSPNIPRGGSLPVSVSVDRLDGFNGHVDVRIEGLPEGITATSTRIGPDMYTGVLTLTASQNALPGGPGVSAPGLSPAATASNSTGNQPADAGRSPPVMKVVASARIGDQVVEHQTSPGFGGHHITVTSPPDLGVQVEPAVAVISPGEEVRFKVTIERRNAFKGRVPVEVLNLPHGLRVLDVGLNGVLINEDETSRSFVVACDPWAEPGPVPFYAAARVEAKNERHSAAPLELQVRIPPQ